MTKGCTVLISLGRSSANRRTILVKNRDIASISSPEIIVIAKTAGGNKYLGMATVENPLSLTIGINEKGVAANKAGRYCNEVNPEGVNSGIIMQRALQSAGDSIPPDRRLAPSLPHLRAKTHRSLRCPSTWEVSCSSCE